MRLLLPKIYFSTIIIKVKAEFYFGLYLMAWSDFHFKISITFYDFAYGFYGLILSLGLVTNFCLIIFLFGGKSLCGKEWFYQFLNGENYATWKCHHEHRDRNRTIFNEYTMFMILVSKIDACSTQFCFYESCWINSQWRCIIHLQKNVIKTKNNNKIVLFFYHSILETV